MKNLLALFAFGVLSCTASALDYDATNESIWLNRFGTLPRFEISDTALRLAIEWQIFDGPVPKINTATHYGLQLARWERAFKQFPFAQVADEYINFLGSLKVEISRNQK